jgi:hypothetical protein
MVKLYRLQIWLLQDHELMRTFFVYTKGGRSLSPAAESFIDFLFSFVATHERNMTVARAALAVK